MNDDLGRRGARVRRTRTYLSTVLPIGLLALSLAPYLVAWDRLPEPLAGHWSLSGRPDAFMPRLVALGITLIMVLVASGVAAKLVRRRNAGQGELAAPVAASLFIGTLGSMFSLVTVRANLDATSWLSAGGVGPATVLGVLAVAALVGAWAFRRARDLESPESTPVPGWTPAARRLKPGESAAWSGTARSRWAPVGAAVGIAGAAAALAFGRVPMAGLLLTVALVFVPFTAVWVTAGPAGVRVAYGPFLWPVSRVRMDLISSASSVEVRPAQWGGWGYRGSLKLFGKAAVVLRAGEGLRLDLRNGRVFLVTVDGAGGAAGVINEQLVPGRR